MEMQTSVVVKEFKWCNRNIWWSY